MYPNTLSVAKVKRNQIQMMIDRGYAITPTEDNMLKMTDEELWEDSLS